MSNNYYTIVITIIVVIISAIIVAILLNIFNNKAHNNVQTSSNIIAPECVFSGRTVMGDRKEFLPINFISRIENKEEKKVATNNLQRDLENRTVLISGNNKITPATIIVIYYADWCGACKYFIPSLDGATTVVPTFVVEQSDIPQVLATDVAAFPSIIAYMSDGSKLKYIGPRSRTMIENLDEDSVRNCSAFIRI